MKIRLEQPEDAAAIHALTTAAFKDAPYSDQTEARIVDALREAGALTLSLVAIEDGQIVGHAAFSPVRIDGRPGRWYGLGPVSVAPDRQREGIGSSLITDGLGRLRAMEAEGCVVFGNPGYYTRFGFASDPRLRYEDAPDGYFMRLVFIGPEPAGVVTYHAGFDVA
jgi:putative acetyltransferase